LHDVHARGHARLVPVLRHLVRALERGDGVVEERLRGVGHAQLEIRGGELRLQRKPRVLEVGGTRLLACGRGFGEPADAPPQVEFPVRVERHLVAIRGVARASGACAAADGGEELRARRLDRCARFAITGFCRAQVLVRNLHLLFERVQDGILEHLPPLALGQRIGGFRDDPIAARLLELRRDLGAGVLVVRPDRAAGQGQRAAHGAQGARVFHVD
jgi:hypothetical protein